jgi:hypothetical protein
MPIGIRTSRDAWAFKATSASNIGNRLAAVALPN